MPRGATARLFVAIDPPASVCQALSMWARDAALARSLPAGARAGRPLRVLEPDSLHLTLIFLGARPVEEIGAIGAAIGGRRSAVGELSVGAPLWLPARRPRALAIEIHDPHGGLAELHREVSSAVAAATGWEPERRHFRAHVTVVRVPGRAAGDRRSHRAEEALPATPQLCFTPATLVLYRSRLSPAGAAYEALATCELGCADA